MITLAIKKYEELLISAFSPYLISSVLLYASQLPDEKRLVKHLTKNKVSLGDSWCSCQLKRSPVIPIQEDSERVYKVITKDIIDTKEYVTEKYMLGQCSIECYLWANRGSVIELAEVMYYQNLYRSKVLNIEYNNREWDCKISHDILQGFGNQNLEEYGTLLFVNWIAIIYVPILKVTEIGALVETIRTDIYADDIVVASYIEP